MEFPAYENGIEERTWYSLLFGDVRLRPYQAVPVNEGNAYLKGELRVAHLSDLYDMHAPDPQPVCASIRSVHTSTISIIAQSMLYIFVVYSTGLGGIALTVMANYYSGGYSVGDAALGASIILSPTNPNAAIGNGTDGRGIPSPSQDNLIITSVCTVIMLCLLSALMLLGVLLLHFTNEHSISGMVAQRHNKLSYFTILAINGTSFFCAAFILMLGALEFYIESLMNDGKVPFLRSRLPYQYVCMGISPILCSLILIFPLAVVKNGAELSAVPLDAQYFETVSSNRRVGQEKQRREDVLAGTAFRLTFYSGTSRAFHGKLHLSALGLGMCVGYVGAIWHLYDWCDKIRVDNGSEHGAISSCWRSPTAWCAPFIVCLLILISVLLLIAFVCLSHFVDARTGQSFTPNEKKIFRRIRRIVFWCVCRRRGI